MFLLFTIDNDVASLSSTSPRKYSLPLITQLSRKLISFGSSDFLKEF